MKLIKIITAITVFSFAMAPFVSLQAAPGDHGKAGQKGKAGQHGKAGEHGQGASHGKGLKLGFRR